MCKKEHPIKLGDIPFTILIGIFAGLSYLVTAEMYLAPGVQYRLFAFIAPGLGIILGKYRGGIAAGTAEGIWALLSYSVFAEPVLSIATPFAIIGNFFQAYIPALMVERYCKKGGYEINLHNLGVMLSGAVLGLIVLSFIWFGIFFEVLGVAPYFVIVENLWYSDFLPIVIGTAPFVWLLMRSKVIKSIWNNRW